MTLVVSEAVVLHAFDYLESSRILRLITRDWGIQSVLARGARSSRKRFGTSLDVFVQGTAEYSTRPGRDLSTLTAFDATRARPELVAGISRFTGACALAELALRFSSDEPHPGLFDAFINGLDMIGVAPPEHTVSATLAAAWHIVGELGFAPALDVCANCHAQLPDEARTPFSHVAGGALCDRCAQLVRGARSIPLEARKALAAWLAGSPMELGSASEGRAHQRLLREFLDQHLSEGKRLTAYAMWEREELSISDVPTNH
ncbi:MAG TPA: DNA repair protein RecO [Gemmatimonadaceae bacterium]|nr:DNA repair protein RecO [Gemmatimonadaceae bacterium]